MVEPIFHVARESEWVAARPTGDYAGSSHDISEVGYVHAAYAHQLDHVLELLFASVTEPLVVLAIDPERLDAPVEEGPAASGEQFPRIYGRINREAVTEVRPVLRTDRHDDLRTSVTPATPRPAWPVPIAVVVLVCLLLGLVLGIVLT